jgi:hypothetical protein
MRTMTKMGWMATALLVATPLAAAVADDGPELSTGAQVPGFDDDRAAAAGELLAAARAGPGAHPSEALEAARLALRDRARLGGGEPQEALRPRLAEEQAQLATAARFFAGDGGLLAGAPGGPGDAPRAPPSEVAAALASADGVHLTASQRASLRLLDARAPAARDALASVLDAFLSFDAASRAAFRGLRPVDAQAARAMQEDSAPLASLSALPRPGLARVFAAREVLMASAMALPRALGPAGPQEGPCAPVQVPPVFSIDLADCANLYAQDFALVVDAGGDDVYLNNAGGSSLGASCDLVHAPAAALVDLKGSDRYASGRGCGINGGGWLGAGFLLDVRGDDVYDAAGSGVNGGGFYGAGFLADLQGRDAYAASDDFAANGGGVLGTGFLLDAEGADTYAAGSEGANGGGWGAGTGFLFDAAGDDAYRARERGGNGGANLGSAGLLLDASGDDRYEARQAAVNGGGLFAAQGFLVDMAGSDRYVAGSFGTNGGGYREGGGFLLDGGDGSDLYEAGEEGTNGGARGGSEASGFLLDAGGDDRYVASHAGTNGGGSGGDGFLLDAAGNDTYLAGWQGTNGGANIGGSGALIDEAGDDTYFAGALGANGGASLGRGLLFDGAGRDCYADDDGGTGCDRTVVPKGLAGAQVDVA